MDKTLASLDKTLDKSVDRSIDKSIDIAGMGEDAMNDPTQAPIIKLRPCHDRRSRDRARIFTSSP